MTSSQFVNRSHESILNDVLARLFRERYGLPAVAETLRQRQRPDIVARRVDDAVIVEVEFEPADTVDADALSRLGMEIDGKPVQVAFAVAIPNALRTTEQQHLLERLATASFRWQEWRSDGTSGPKVSGNSADLAQAVREAVAPGGNLEQAVALLDEGTRFAGGAPLFLTWHANQNRPNLWNCSQP